MTTTERPKGDQERLLLISSREFVRSGPEKGSHLKRGFHSAPLDESGKWGQELNEFLSEGGSEKADRIKAVFASPYYSLLPEQLQHPGQEAKTLEFLFSEGFRENEVRKERTPTNDPLILYWYPNVLDETLIEKDPGYIPTPLALPGIDELLRIHHREGRACSLLQVRDGEADMGFADEGELLHFSSFSYRNAEELLYFFLSARKERQIEGSNDITHVWGTTEQGEEKELIGRYVKDTVLHEDGKGAWNSFLFDPE